MRSPSQKSLSKPRLPGGGRRLTFVRMIRMKHPTSGCRLYPICWRPRAVRREYARATGATEDFYADLGKHAHGRGGEQ